MINSPGKGSRRSHSVAPVATFLLPALLSLLLAACHPRLPAEPLPAGDPEAFREDLGRRWQGVSSLRAEAGITLTVGASAYPGRMTLVMKKPGLVRTDFFDPFGMLRGLVILSGDTLVEMLPPRNTAGEDPPEAALLDRLLQLQGDAPGEELAALVTGLPGGSTRRTPLRWAVAGDHEPVAEGASLSLRLFKGLPVPASVTLRNRTTGESARVEYRDYVLNGEVPLPRRVTVGLPSRKVLLEITWKLTELNVELDDELFNARPPQ